MPSVVVQKVWWSQHEQASSPPPSREKRHTKSVLVLNSNSMLQAGPMGLACQLRRCPALLTFTALYTTSCKYKIPNRLTFLSIFWVCICTRRATRSMPASSFPSHVCRLRPLKTLRAWDPTIPPTCTRSCPSNNLKLINNNQGKVLREGKQRRVGHHAAGALSPERLPSVRSCLSQ